MILILFFLKKKTARKKLVFRNYFHMKIEYLLCTVIINYKLIKILRKLFHLNFKISSSFFSVIPFFKLYYY